MSGHTTNQLVHMLEEHERLDKKIADDWARAGTQRCGLCAHSCYGGGRTGFCTIRANMFGGNIVLHSPFAMPCDKWKAIV